LGGGRVQLAAQFIAALEFGFKQLLQELLLVRLKRTECGIDRGW
jgi:hypothetical protein